MNRNIKYYLSLRVADTLNYYYPYFGGSTFKHYRSITMYSPDVLRFSKLFQSKIEEIDKQLDKYKRDNNISMPIYAKYTYGIWLIPPYGHAPGLFIDPQAPGEIENLYKSAYYEAYKEIFS